MEPTQDLTCDDVEAVAAAARTVERIHTATIGLPRSILDSRLSLDRLADDVIQWLIETLGFERGFFLLQAEGRTSSAKEAEAAAFEVRGSRLALRSDGETTWREVCNPEYALNRSVIKLGFASMETIAEGDCLVAVDGDSPGQHRGVLCRAFRISPAGRAAIYVDRGLGLDGLTDGEKERFTELVDACVPALGRAYLAEELERARQEVRQLRGDDELEDEEDEETALVESGAPPAMFHGIVGRDEKLRRIFKIVEKVKDSGLNICVFGESGTGKELVARAIHSASQRRDKEFISENCGAISENLLESELFGHMKGAFTGADEDKKGLFELADGGTLFLDEIGDMSEGMQRKLLRALQEGEIRPIGSKSPIQVDVRVVCASNRDLKHLVREGKFRADLYYRLNVIQIQVPPLRERRDDIPLLIDHFTSQLNEDEGMKKRFGESAMTLLCQYSWPGNVRELNNLVRRVLLTSPRRVITRREVSTYLQSSQAATCLGENIERDEGHLLLRIPFRQGFNEIIDECERLVLVNALKENGWNKSRVTKILGIPRQSLYNKIAKYDLQQSWKED